MSKGGVFSLIALLALTLSFAGCGGDREKVASARTNDSIPVARAMLKKAAGLMQADLGDSALKCYRQALALSERLKNDSLVAKSKNGIAGYYLRHEEYPRAVEYLTSALKSSEKAGYDHVTGLIYNGLGLVSVSLKEYDKAIAYFENARKLCHEAGDVQNEAGISQNIAGCYAELNDFARAREYYQKNLEVVRSLGDTSQVILAYINLAIVDRNLRNLQASFSDLDEAVKLLALQPDQSLLCTAMLETGTTYLEQGNLPMARKYLERALAISTGTLSKTNSMEALSRLSTVAGKEGKWKDAYGYYQQYTLVKDSVMNDETRRSIAEIRLKADVQKKEYENELLQRKFEIQQRKTFNLRILFGSFLVVAVLIGVLIWLSMKNLRKSYKLQELANTTLQERIEAKNKELTSISLQLVNKNKILGDISKMTTDLYESKSMDKNSFNGLQRVIRENLNTDRDWEQFKEVFEQVHEGFFTGLKTACPELTENELRLCAYLKINLQNKEIAKMLNVHPDTVTTSRYRIRKKLRLETNTVLEDYLRTF